MEHSAGAEVKENAVLKTVKDLKESNSISMELLLLNFHDFSWCHLELTSILTFCCLNMMQIPYYVLHEENLSPISPDAILQVM